MSRRAIFVPGPRNGDVSGPVKLKSNSMGGTDGFVPFQTSGASVLKLGAGGVLTDPEYEVRTWLNATLFADGELKIGFAKADATGREVLAEGWQSWLASLCCWRRPFSCQSLGCLD